MRINRPILITCCFPWKWSKTTKKAPKLSSFRISHQLSILYKKSTHKLIFLNVHLSLPTHISIVNLPMAAISHFPLWYVSLTYWTTSNAFALSWIDEFEPLNWKIFDLVSRTKMSSWLSEDRLKGTYCHHNPRKLSIYRRLKNINRYLNKNKNLPL